MKLKEKLEGIRDSVVEYAQEVMDTKDLTAEDYAKYYGAGYVNLLNIVKKDLFLKTSETEINEDDEEQVISIEYPVSSFKDNKITFVHRQLGQREVFEYDIVKTMFKKARIAHEMNEDNTSMAISVDKSVRLSDQYKKFLEGKDEYLELLREKCGDVLENKEEYIEKLKGTYETAKEKGKETLKKTLNNAADWANKNL